MDSLNDFSSSTLDRGIALPANSKYNIFAVQGSERDYRLVTETLQKLLAEGLEYEIIYRSIQGERWRIRPEAVEPEPLH